MVRRDHLGLNALGAPEVEQTPKFTRWSTHTETPSAFRWHQVMRMILLLHQI